MNPSLKLRESFNPGNVKAGQWFTRLWIFGEPCNPVRLQVVKVISSPQGRQFCLSTPEGLKMQVDRYSLIKDFRRIDGENGQPFMGQGLSEHSAPEQKRKNWYHET